MPDVTIAYSSPALLRRALRRERAELLGTIVSAAPLFLAGISDLMSGQPATPVLSLAQIAATAALALLMRRRLRNAHGSRRLAVSIDLIVAVLLAFEGFQHRHLRIRIAYLLAAGITFVAARYRARRMANGGAFLHLDEHRLVTRTRRFRRLRVDRADIAHIEILGDGQAHITTRDGAQHTLPVAGLDNRDEVLRALIAWAEDASIPLTRAGVEPVPAGSGDAGAADRRSIDR